MSMQSLFKRFRSKLLWTVFVVILVINFITIVPVFMVNTLIGRVSEGKLKIYNQSGTFWHGSGLLVINDYKARPIAPLILLNWQISFGFSKFITLHLYAGNSTIADVYVNKSGINVDNLSLSLSATQTAKLLDFIKDMQLSGNIHVTSKHILINKNKAIGEVAINFSNVSSGLSPVNPLGDYAITLNAASGAISVTSKPGATLSLSGNGSLNSLEITAKVAKDKQEALRSFIIALSDGSTKDSYLIKIF